MGRNDDSLVGGSRVDRTKGDFSVEVERISGLVLVLLIQPFSLSCHHFYYSLLLLDGERKAIKDATW